MKKTLYYTEDHCRELLITHEFQVTMRKDGSAKAEIRLPFLDGLTILDSFVLARCSKTPEEAVSRFLSRMRRKIETLDRERDRLTDAVARASSEDIPVKPFARYRSITAHEEP